jgi:hypothetical protein
MVNEEVDIDSDDEMDLENERESASEESSDEKSESESESETSWSVDGWKEVTTGDRKPKAYSFTKNGATIKPSARCRAHRSF